MIRFVSGDLLSADAEAVVNAVNTVGVMGKGIALLFKNRFPKNYKAYVAACQAGEVRVGKMFVTSNIELAGPRWIINFPTKADWRQPTQPEWVRAGLVSLDSVIQELGIHSVAIPALGCGNGGLEWCNVRPMIESALGHLSDVEVIVFEPMAENQNLSIKHSSEKRSVRFGRAR